MKLKKLTEDLEQAMLHSTLAWQDTDFGNYLISNSYLIAIVNIMKEGLFELVRGLSLSACRKHVTFEDVVHPEFIPIHRKWFKVDEQEH